MDNRFVHSAVGVILNDKQCLIAKRKPGTYMEGFWEFPGGKVELGESIVDALKRELDEEVGILPVIYYPLFQKEVPKEYGSLLLDFWVITDFHGVASGREGQDIRWVQIKELVNIEMLPGSHDALAAIKEQGYLS